MLIRRMRSRSHSRPAWDWLAKINIHLELSVYHLFLLCCKRRDCLNNLSWGRLKYLVLRHSDKITLQLRVCNWPPKLLRVRCRRSSLCSTHALRSSFVVNGNFSFVYELVICTCSILLVLLPESIAVRFFVHTWAARRDEILMLMI